MVKFRRWSVWKLETVWAGVVVVAVAVLLELGAVEAQEQHAAPYYYTPVASPPPAHEEVTPHYQPLIPAPHTTLHGGSGHRLLKAVVMGRVLCRKCQERRPLSGAQVAVVCWNEDSEASFYGVTNADGLYRIELEGYDYAYGGNACRAKLLAVQPDSPCKMPADVTAMAPVHLHVKSKTEEEVVLYSKSFTLLAASSVEECIQRPSTHAYYYPSPPHHGLSPISHEYQNHPPPPLILHQSPPPHPHACTLPPPPHLPSHIPPPLYHYYTPQQPPLYPPPHHENTLPTPPYHKQVTPLPPHATDHFYSPPPSYYKPAYPPPYAHPEIHPPPLYHNAPSTLTPPYKYESPPPPAYHHEHPTLPPPVSPHIEVPYPPPAGDHETPIIIGQTPPHPAPILRGYDSPPPPQMLPPYEYHPPPVDYNAHQSSQGTPSPNSQIPSFYKSTRVSPPAS